MEEILDALASSHFRSLRNYGDRWGISHLSFDGVSIAEIFGDHLDALLDTENHSAAAGGWGFCVDSGFEQRGIVVVYGQDGGTLR